jgi:hypothetical protein
MLRPMLMDEVLHRGVYRYGPHFGAVCDTSYIETLCGSISVSEKRGRRGTPSSNLRLKTRLSLAGHVEEFDSGVWPRHCENEIGPEDASSVRPTRL